MAAACGDESSDRDSKPAATGQAQEPAEVRAPEPTTTDAQEPDPQAREEEPPGDDAAQAQRFFFRMDNYAIALDEAIGQALDGDQSAIARIGQLRKRILKRVNNRLLAGADTSVGGNLLLSAATTARDAARTGDLARLASQREAIAEARSKLAEEALA